jgi:4-carboxymuconolactone decarboxylase
VVAINGRSGMLIIDAGMAVLDLPKGRWAVSLAASIQSRIRQEPLMTASKSRLGDIDPAKLSPAQKRVYDVIVAGPRGRVEGPLRVWLTSPDFAERAQNLGAFCRFGSSLPPRLSELAILVTGAHWKAGFEWWAHAPLGIAAGLDPAAVEQIKLGKTPDLPKADEAVVYAVANDIWQTKRVSPSNYKRAIEVLGEQAVVELVGLVGYYGLISITINAFEVEVPAGEKEPFGT